MASRVACENGHSYGRILDAAREISENKSLNACVRCGSKRHYFVEHYYPYDQVKVKYEVEKVIRLLPSDRAEKEGWEPMFFLMRNLKDGSEVVWPYYWTKNRKGKWSNGQFPPLLSIEDLEKVIEIFK